MQNQSRIKRLIINVSYIEQMAVLIPLTHALTMKQLYELSDAIEKLRQCSKQLQKISKPQEIKRI